MVHPSLGLRATLKTLSAFCFMFLGTAPLSFAAAGPTRIDIAYPSPSPRVAPLWVAQDMDFFGKHGLRGQAVLVRNNTMLTAGFASGDINLAYTGGTTVLGVAATGTESKMVLGFVSRGRGFLMVKPDIRKPADLAGKKFGVQSIGGTLWMYAMLGLEHLSLDVARDKIHFVVVGDQPLMMRALESGVIDAMMSTTRAFALDLRKKGFHMLAEVLPPMAATGLVVRKQFLEKNPAVVENTLKALIEAEYFLLAPSGKAQTIKTIMNRLKMSDASLAEEGYNDIVKEFEPKPYPSLEGMKNMQRLMALQNPKFNELHPTHLIDASFLKKLEDSGFFAQLQARYRE